MKEVDKKTYLKMKSDDLKWANQLLEYKLTDNRPGVMYRDIEPFTDLKDMINKSCKKHSNNIAFYTKFEKGQEYQKITYKELHSDVDALGTALIKHKLKDKRIAVIGETNYTWSISYLSIICGTGIVVPIDKELPYRDIKNIITETQASAVIFDEKREDIFIKMLEEKDTKLKVLISQTRKEKEGKVLSIYELIEEGKKLIKEKDKSFINAQIDSQEMAVILYTSGTTGLSKGIMLSHRNLCSNLLTSPAVLWVGEYEIFFSVLPIHHTFECMANFLIPLSRGSAIAHCEGLKYITKNINEVHPTFMLIVPAILEALHKQVWKNAKKQGKEKKLKTALKLTKVSNKIHLDLSDKFFTDIKESLGGHLRMIIVGGAKINPEILDDFKAFGFNALQGYGLSEASPFVAINPDTNPKSSSIGIPIPGTIAKIIDPDENGIGEIIVKSDSIMLGYYNNKKATDDVMIDGFFRTGDLGYIDKDGYIYITGRKKNVIITKNGKNVFPEEIELQLLEYDEISEVMVFEGDSSNKDDTLIVANIYPNHDVYKDMSEDEIRISLSKIVDEVNSSNPTYKMIKKILLKHSEFEKNTSNKIKRYKEENKEEL